MEWYLADLVVSIDVERDERTVVHVNTVLIQADSPESAYQAALELGENENCAYSNPMGDKVTFKFRGLRDLFMIGDVLEHGTEIIYEEKIDVSESRIEQMLSDKEMLAVFSKSVKIDKPNYMPKSIYDDIIAASFTKEELE